MNCPSCNKPLTENYKTILTCNNFDCLMSYAILSREQWKFIATANADLLAALAKIQHTLARGRNVGQDWVAAAINAEEIARAAIAEVKEQP